MDASRPHEFESVTAIPSIAIGRSPGGSRAPTALIAWVLALAGLVSFGVLGRLADTLEPGPRTAAVVFDPPVMPRPVEPAATSAPLPDLIVLASPAEAGMTVTSRSLLVRGYVESAGDTVRVTLEARGNRIIDQATVRPRLAFGERPEANRHPWFEVEFGLPNPRPNGRMIVQVAAFDREGRMIDVVRRPFRVGAVLDNSISR